MTDAELSSIVVTPSLIRTTVTIYHCVVFPFFSSLVACYFQIIHGDAQCYPAVYIYIFLWLLILLMFYHPRYMFLGSLYINANTCMKSMQPVCY